MQLISLEQFQQLLKPIYCNQVQRDKEIKDVSGLKQSVLRLKSCRRTGQFVH